MGVVVKPYRYRLSFDVVPEDDDEVPVEIEFMFSRAERLTSADLPSVLRLLLSQLVPKRTRPRN
jgi:hypothetical protein